MSFLGRRRAERIYREGGWGPLLSFPVVRPDASKLVFQVRMPLGIELVDLAQIAAEAPGAPPAVAQGTRALERVRSGGHVILIGALRPSQPEDRHEVVATMTVAIAAVSRSALPKASEEHDAEGNLTASTEVVELSDDATLVKRVSRESLGEGTEPVPMLVMQYLVRTRYGVLAMAFSTTHEGMFGEGGRKLFLQITKTGFIGEGPAPY